MSTNDKTAIDFFIQLRVFLSLVKHGTPTDDELEDLGCEIGEKWEELGRRLGVRKSRLQEIDHARAKLSGKGYHMLIHWKEKTGSAATYEVLSNALKHKFVERQDLAEQFCYINGNYFLHCYLDVYI